MNKEQTTLNEDYYRIVKRIATSFYIGYTQDKRATTHVKKDTRTIHTRIPLCNYVLSVWYICWLVVSANDVA